MSVAKSAVVVFWFLFSVSVAAAQPSFIAAVPATRYSYSFTNFVWWSDTALRAELARRIPGLRPEIAQDSRDESRIRTVLELLLKQKGIQANVQSIEPSQQDFGKRDPEAPPPSIQFSILAPPEIVIESLVIENGPPEAMETLGQEANSLQGRSYATTRFWLIKEQAKDALQGVGYLTANVDIAPGQPKKDGERYAVKVIASITSGPKFHVANVEGDGGPLLQGRDLSPYFALKTGDVATPNAFGRLIGSLRSVYWHAGYADVSFDGAPVLDMSRALASYQLRIIPGPLYHLRSIKMEGLAAAQEEEARRGLGLKSGDVYDALAVSRFNMDSSKAWPSLEGYGFTYSPREDKQDHVVDLTLNFFKK
jgi:outer membrane protein assembly factor BamA